MKLGGGAMILIVIVSLLFGVNPLQFLGMMEGGALRSGSGRRPRPSPRLRVRPAGRECGQKHREPRQGLQRRRAGRHRGRLVGTVPGDGSRYEPPKLVLFRRSVRSKAAGKLGSGPFYCAATASSTSDTAFFQELHNRFGAPGDFAQAYVIAHEVGHHVQN
jgi:predicted metalloprotease